MDGVIDGFRSLPPVSKPAIDIRQFGDLSGEQFERVGSTYKQISDSLHETSPNRSTFKVEMDDCDLSKCIGRAMAVSDTISQRVLAAGIVARASPINANVKKVCACSGKTLWQERDEQQQHQSKRAA